jgi:hypothetical protein
MRTNALMIGCHRPIRSSIHRVSSAEENGAAAEGACNFGKR